VEPASPRPPFPEPPETAAAAAADGSSSAERACGGFYTARDSRNLRRFNLWMVAAMLAYLGATAALRWRGSMPRALPWGLVGLASLLALQATRSYLVFLRGADELLRRIQTEALALGFVSGAVFSLLYPLLEALGAPKLDGHATALVMMLSLGAGSWLGTRRYSAGSAP
jgi:hypothetical protein